MKEVQVPGASVQTGAGEEKKEKNVLEKREEKVNNLPPKSFSFPKHKEGRQCRI